MAEAGLQALVYVVPGDTMASNKQKSEQLPLFGPEKRPYSDLASNPKTETSDNRKGKQNIA